MNKQFLLIFCSVVTLTILCGGVDGYIAIEYGGNMSPSLAEYQEKLSCLFTAGAGAIIGLLGGRASSSGK
jgi:hypothetical protein